MDVTTIGATIIYGFLSDFVYRDAKSRGDRTEEMTGILGIMLMIGFAVLLLAPKIMSYEAMEAESYLLFEAWSLFGILVFRLILIRDNDNQYGHSVIVWIGLLMLMLMTIMLWKNRETQKVTDDAMNSIGQYYREQFEEGKSLGDEADLFLETEEIRIENTSARGTLAAFFIFMLAAAEMLNNFQLARKREIWLDLRENADGKISL